MNTDKHRSKKMFCCLKKIWVGMGIRDHQCKSVANLSSFVA